MQGLTGGGGRLLPNTLRVDRTHWVGALPRLAGEDAWLLSRADRGCRLPRDEHPRMRSSVADQSSGHPGPTCSRAPTSSPHAPNPVGWHEIDPETTLGSSHSLGRRRV